MQGQTKLLAIHNKPAKLREFKKALDKGISVDVREKFGLPSNLQAMTEYDAPQCWQIQKQDTSIPTDG